MNDSRPSTLLIVLNSLAREGCPQLALQLTRHWRQRAVSVELLCLQDHPDDLRPDFEGLSVPIHGMALGSGLRRYGRLVLASFRLCRRLRPRAVLCFPLGWHAFLALGARAAGVPRVCAHVGNLPPVWTGLAFAKFRLQVQLGRLFTWRLLCCSDHVRRATIRDFAVAPRETRTVFNACALDRFTPAAAVSAHAPARLGVVGRLDEHRDYTSFIDALALLRDQGLSLSAWLIGDGHQATVLKSRILALGLDSHVQLLGNRPDIPALLLQLDVFVWPALELEGFGIALAEAMAAGVPIVATDVGACREVLDDGRCGLLVAPASPEALAAGIRHALADPEAARQRALAARERALRLFSVSAMAEAYGQELGLP